MKRRRKTSLGASAGRPLYRVLVQGRRGVEDLIETGSAKHARRLFEVACKYGTTSPGRRPRKERGKHVRLEAGEAAYSPSYGRGVEPEQLYPFTFRVRRRLGRCET